MLDDILVQTLDGKIYFSEGGKAFQLLEFEKTESAALSAVLAKTAGAAVGVSTIVHGRFGNEHMLNGGALWLIADVEKTIAGAGSAVAQDRQDTRTAG
jgi:hypothetical protein